MNSITVGRALRGVALVAARTKEIAEAALRLIKVNYEPLPVVSDPEAALEADAPKIHGADNVFVHHKVRKGDVAAGFAQADFTLEWRFRTPCIEHSYLEPEAVLAEPAEQGGVIVTGSVQNLFSSRRSVAAALKLDLNRVEIIQATLGGSFGGKDEVMTSMCCRAALLALTTGKPVKMVNGREESRAPLPYLRPRFAATECSLRYRRSPVHSSHQECNR